LKVEKNPLLPGRDFSLVVKLKKSLCLPMEFIHRGRGAGYPYHAPGNLLFTLQFLCWYAIMKSIKEVSRKHEPNKACDIMKQNKCSGRRYSNKTKKRRRSRMAWRTRTRYRMMNLKM
jgi:hypothetical protein